MTVPGTRVYRALLCLLPADVRARDGAELVAGFAACRAREVARRGRIGLATAWVRAIADLLAAAWWLRLDRRSRRRSAARVTHRHSDWSPRLAIIEILRHSLRRVRRQPGYALMCAATLALGLGTSLASLTLVKRTFFDALPYAAADRLMTIWTVVEGNPSVTSMHVFEELRQQSRTLAQQAAFRSQTVSYSGPDGVERITGMAVSSQFFDVLGVAPAAGRAWLPDQRQAIVLSWPWWQRAFGGSPAVVGQTVTIDGADLRVAGIMPADFTAPFQPEAQFWMPLDVEALLREPRARRSLTIVGRLSPTAEAAHLDTELALFDAQLKSRLPVIHGREALTAEPLRDALIGPARPILLATAGGAALLLLAVAATVGGLSAARAASLRAQFALRRALGASRGRLVLEQLAESCVIAVAGCAAATWIAHGLVKLAGAYQRSYLPRMDVIALDAGTLALGWAVGLAASVLAVLLPYLGVTSFELERGDALREARTVTARHTRTRMVLVTMQVSFALALMVGAGLLIRTVHHLSTIPLGYDASAVLTMPAPLPGPRYREPANQIAFERQVLERLRQLPGVVSASVGGPLAGGMGASLTIRGQAQPDGRPTIGYIPVSPDFLQTYNIPVLQGRALQATDTADTPPVVLINDTMARRFFPDGRAVGSQVQIGPDPNGPWITIAGVVPDVRQDGVINQLRPVAYGSTAQFSFPSRVFSVRVEHAPASLRRDMVSVVRAIDATVPVGAVSRLDEALHRDLARQRLTMYALLSFGATALLLCGLGVYGVVALSARLRRREFAIRTALGALPASIRWIVFRQAVLVASVGTAAGVAIAVAGTRTLSGLLHGVTPLDTGSFVAATAAVWALAVLAAWLPARHAGRADPVSALNNS